jgi:hypothetical protein
MPRLQLESGGDVIRLDEQERTGLGHQVHVGVTGLGLPSVTAQWVEGAGDGATFRGSRALPRDIDLPVSILAKDRDHLKDLTSDLILALSRECTLRFVEDDGTSWYTKVHRVGGGQYVYGGDTVGARELQTVLTVRAGDPYWTSGSALQAKVSAKTIRGLLPRLVNLQVSTSQAIGKMNLENPGNADAYPTWYAHGPGDNFKAVSPVGEVLHWTGSLLVGESLAIDTKNASVVDNTGANRYAELASAPRLWRIPPGNHVAEVSFQNTTADSRVECTWRPRRWAVI